MRARKMSRKYFLAAANATCHSSDDKISSDSANNSNASSGNNSSASNSDQDNANNDWECFVCSNHMDGDDVPFSVFDKKMCSSKCCAVYRSKLESAQPKQLEKVFCKPDSGGAY